MPIPLVIEDGPSRLPHVDGRDAAWGGLALVAAFIVTAAVAFLSGSLAGADYLLLGVPAGTLAFWVALWAALVRHRKWSWGGLGFVSSRRSFWHLVWQVPVALMTSLVGAALLGAIVNVQPGTERQRGVIDSLNIPVWMSVTVALCTVLLFPAAEEVIFRRLLLDWLRTKLPSAAAVLIATAVFAAVHLVPAVMIYVLFLGLSACVLRLWHRSLWAPLALHATNNAIVAMIVIRA